MSTVSTANRERPRSNDTHQTRGERSSHSDPKQIRARAYRIRNAWSQEERLQRAYTARMVQWLLLGPPTGFRLEAE